MTIRPSIHNQKGSWGGGNVTVWNDCVNAWGEEARPVVVGSSVHKQRIERHNQAVNEQVFIGFKQEFYDLETEGILDPLNETYMFCLQYIYLPKFTDAHNNHAVSTERNNSPAELFWLSLYLTAF